MVQNVPTVVVPIITPFNADGSVYEQGFENILGFLHEKGIRGVWILGSYGAFPLLSPEEREQTAEIAVRIAKSLGMYAIVQVGSPGVEMSVRLARHAASIGADALASTVPFYFSSAHYTPRNFLAYFDAVLKATDLPLIYYNNPKTTGYTPTLEFVRDLVRLGVMGIKDTTTDFLTISQKIALFAEENPKAVYFGGSASTLLPSLMMGAPAGVCGTAMAMPEVVTALVAAFQGGDIAESRRLQHLLIKLREAQARHIGRSVACYDILHGRGVDAGTTRTPWLRMTPEQAQEVMADVNTLLKEV
jgi:dihydrodipicolinate synthase/N-acetylneuraminate lyase